MRSPWWLLLGLALAGIAGGTRAAIPESAVVVSCANDIHLIQLSNKTFAVAEGADALTTQSPRSLAAKPLTLVGALASAKRVSRYLGAHPVLFVDMQEPGRAQVLLGTDVGLAQQVLEYSVTFSVTRSVMCAPRAAFPAVQQAVAELPQVPDSTYLGYIDSQMALSCRSADRPAAPVSHLVRALSFEPASSQLQVWDVTRDFYSDSRIELEKFEDRQSDVLYYPAARPGPTGSSDPSPEPAELLLTKTPGLDGLGESRYAAQLFDGKRRQRLLCEALQAFVSNIEKPLALARTLVRPKSLPLPAGTLAQARREYCADIEGFKVLQVRYGELLFKVPGVNSHGIGQYRSEESPVKIQCYCLSIGVRSAALLAQAQAMIGETLEGHLVRYEVRGDAVGL